MRIFFTAALFALAAPVRAQTLVIPPDLRAFSASVPEAPPAPPANPTAVGPASIWYEPPVPGLESPEVRAYAEEAAKLAAAGADFSAVFAGLCRRLVDGDPGLRRTPRHEAANMFRGLIRWTRGGGKPVLQGRSDWPLHFIYGGYLGFAYGHPAAEAAAYAKEERDAFSSGNFFDLDDYAVTLIGARWALKAGHGRASVETWARPWADGRKTLNTLPRLQFGHLPPRRLPVPALLLRVRGFVRAAL
ncbi:MAG: hypothetical protein HY077_04200 [Elusimicrobia bacterium]|nr:hypothetical protein [Elusimicrobiota bacterium]